MAADSLVAAGTVSSAQHRQQVAERHLRTDNKLVERHLRRVARRCLPTSGSRSQGLHIATSLATGIATGIARPHGSRGAARPLGPLSSPQPTTTAA